jgi:hypothetical protein
MYMVQQRIGGLRTRKADRSQMAGDPESLEHDQQSEGSVEQGRSTLTRGAVNGKAQTEVNEESRQQQESQDG